MEYNPPPKSDSQEARPEASAFHPEISISPDPPYLYKENARDLKHSGPGIASFVIALVTFIGYAVSFVIVGAESSSNVNESNQLMAGSAEIFMFLGTTVLILAALNVIGAVIGIIGLTLHSRRKIFAVIGTVINGVILILFMLLIATVLVKAGSF